MATYVDATPILLQNSIVPWQMCILPTHEHRYTPIPSQVLAFWSFRPQLSGWSFFLFGLLVIKSTTPKMYLTLFLFASVYPRRAQPRDASIASGWHIYFMLLMDLTCISRCSKQLRQSTTYSGSQHVPSPMRWYHLQSNVVPNAVLPHGMKSQGCLVLVHPLSL